MGEAVTAFGEPFIRQQLLLLVVTHLHEHLGQAIAYVRINGIVPPWSRTPDEPPMSSSRYWTTAILLGAVVFGPRPAEGQAPPVASEDPALRQLVTDYIGLYRRDALDRWQTLFLPSFSVAFTNADGSITQRNLEQFVERQRQGFARTPDMHEVLENVRIDQQGRLASVWADFVFTADGQSRRGKLVMLCIRDAGAWRIQSLLFSYHDGG